MTTYDVVFPKDSRSSWRLDRDKARSCIKELLELRDIQQMPDGEEKRALLEAVDEDVAEFAHDPARTEEAMIKCFETQKVMAECRLKLQDAFDAYKVAFEVNKDARDTFE